MRLRFSSAVVACLVGAMLVPTPPSGATLPEPVCDPRVPVVTLPAGDVCGTVRINPALQESFTYLGIPFAEPPTGDLRWKSPVPVTRFDTEPLAAVRYADGCVQPAPTATGYTGSEDCLYLNVFRPADTEATNLPVLVYIHGGAFLVAQSPHELNGTAFADQGAIVVTLSYRLGPLGFLRYVDNGAGIAGNFAMQDQQLAMKWVHENIASFGGDPERITLFGESAGAMAVGMHLFTAPSSASYFRAAIMQSNVMGLPMPTRQESATKGAQFVDLLCSSYASGPCPANASWLRGLSTQQIAQAEGLDLPTGGMSGSLVAAMLGETLWGPTQGVAPLTNHAPIDGFAPGTTPKPYVFGVNGLEGAFFQPAPATLTAGQYREFLVRAFGTVDAQRILDYRENGRRLYAPASYRPMPVRGMTAAARALARLQTDYMVAAPNMVSAQAARAAMGDLPTFGYRFIHQASFDFTGLQRCWPTPGGPCHTDEIPFVWNDLVYKDAFGITVPVPDPSEADRALAQRMNTAWFTYADNPSAGLGSPRLSSITGDDYVIWGQGDTVTTGTLMPPSRYRLWKPLVLSHR